MVLLALPDNFLKSHRTSVNSASVTLYTFTNSLLKALAASTHCLVPTPLHTLCFNLIIINYYCYYEVTYSLFQLIWLHNKLTPNVVASANIYYAHEFCGLGTWTGHSGDSLPFFSVLGTQPEGLKAGAWKLLKDHSFTCLAVDAGSWLGC